MAGGGGATQALGPGCLGFGWEGGAHLSAASGLHPHFTDGEAEAPGHVLLWETMGTEVSHLSLHFRTRQGQDLGLTQQAPRSRRGGRGCSPPSRDAAAVVRAVRAGPGGAGGRGAVGVGGAAAALLPGARAHAALRHGGPALHPVGARAPAPAEPRCGRGSAARMRQSQGGRKTLPGGCAGWVTQGRPHRHPTPGSCGSPRG